MARLLCAHKSRAILPSTPPAASTRPRGRVLAAGGVDEVGVISGAEVYDPSQDARQVVGCMIKARCCFEMAVLADGTILAAGGYNSQDEPLASAELKLTNPATCSWSSAGSMTDGRGSFAMVAL